LVLAPVLVLVAAVLAARLERGLEPKVAARVPMVLAAKAAEFHRS
jgi:hypothetical protein